MRSHGESGGTASLAPFTVVGLIWAALTVMLDGHLTLVGAVLAEQNDEWTESRRYMELEILASCRKAAHPDYGKE